MTQHTDPARRHDFIMYFDCIDGNPNGDPDAGNLPRVDPETMQGLVSDVAMKRKLRDWVAAYKEDDPAGYHIYVEQGSVLNAQHERAYEAIEKDPKKDKDRVTINEAKRWMCKNFFDVRTFGAVMSTGVNCGQVRGPVQMTFARSVDAILPMDVTITRVAVTKKAQTTKKGAQKETEMGRKALIPYGLYRAHGFVTPQFAKDTGFNSQDLELLWRALVGMWELDRSATRGMMACRGLYVFSHQHKLGNAPAHQLFERVSATRTSEGPARAFSDYTITLEEDAMPEGVHLTRVIG